ncbi:MAG: hypothetical protein IJ062_04745, partial [Firmicutes bacterium]|nr:hypothetical protein [Bacillota bacterium]
VKKTGGQEFPAIRQKVYDAIKNNDQTENAIINYVLTQAASDKVSFATKGGKTYVCFNNDVISDFFNDWFVVVSAHHNNKMSDNTYRPLLKAMISMYSLSEDDENSK